jgi:hypothetical protein
MSAEFSVEELLRWRLARAEAEAPPAPRARQLLDGARPWWDVWPERFQAYLERLRTIQVAYGHAMTEVVRGRSGHPVPTLVTGVEAEIETAARVLYFSVRDGRLRLRFQLEAGPERPRTEYEVTFVSEPGGRPLLSANAVASVENEYRLDADVSTELANAWEALKVTDRMPYRLILGPVVSGR